MKPPLALFADKPLTNAGGKMHDGVRNKLAGMAEAFDELEAQMSDPEIIADNQRYTGILRKRGAMTKLVGMYRKYVKIEQQIADAGEMIESGDDRELAAMAREEMESLEEAIEKLDREILEAVATQDEDASRNVIVEIRAGTGGDEAAIFVGDLFRMYSRYAEEHNWKIETMNAAESDMGGFKEVIFGIQGTDVYKYMRFESGTHRVQRVPKTETQGRIHTSACTVAVLPEAEEVEVNINKSDLDISYAHSSGPGGQHVNKTQSAVRIIHKPTGLQVFCQDEKSQHKNKAQAMRVLSSRLYDFLKQQRDAERSQQRRGQIGSGDRSERIRTYNYPQNRITDHRINLTLYDLEGIMEGQMGKLTGPLIQHQKEERLKAL